MSDHQWYQDRDPAYGPPIAPLKPSNVFELAKQEWKEGMTDKERDRVSMKFHKRYLQQHGSDDKVPRFLGSDPQPPLYSRERNPLQDRVQFLTQNDPRQWVPRMVDLFDKLTDDSEKAYIRKKRYPLIVAEMRTLGFELSILRQPNLILQQYLHELIVPVVDMEPDTCIQFSLAAAKELTKKTMIDIPLIQALMEDEEKVLRNAVSRAKARVTTLSGLDSSAKTARKLEVARLQLQVAEDALADFKSHQNRSVQVEIAPGALAELARKAHEEAKRHGGNFDRAYDEAFARLRREYQLRHAPPARPISDALAELEDQMSSLRQQIRPLVRQMAEPEGIRLGRLSGVQQVRPVHLWEKTAYLYQELVRLENIYLKKKQRIREGREEDIAVDANSDGWQELRRVDLAKEIDELARWQLAVSVSQVENSRRRSVSPDREEALSRRHEYLKRKQLIIIDEDIDRLSQKTDDESKRQVEDLRVLKSSLQEDSDDEGVVARFREKLARERKAMDVVEDIPENKRLDAEITELLDRFTENDDVSYLKRALQKQEELGHFYGTQHLPEDYEDQLLDRLPGAVRERARRALDEERFIASAVEENKKKLERMQLTRQKEPIVIDLRSSDESSSSEEEEQEEEDEEQDDEEEQEDEKEEEQEEQDDEHEGDDEEEGDEKEEDDEEEDDEEEPRVRKPSSRRVYSAEEIARLERQRARELAKEVDDSDQLMKDLESEDGDDEEEEEEEDEEADDEQADDEEEEEQSDPTRDPFPGEEIERIPVRTAANIKYKVVLTSEVKLPVNEWSIKFVETFQGHQRTTLGARFNQTWQDWVAGDDVEMVHKRLPVLTLSQMLQAIEICIRSKNSSVRMLEYLYCRAGFVAKDRNSVHRYPGELPFLRHVVEVMVNTPQLNRSIKDRFDDEDAKSRSAPCRVMHMPARFTRAITYDDASPADLSSSDEELMNLLSKFWFVCLTSPNPARFDNALNTALSKYSDADKTRVKSLLP